MKGNRFIAVYVTLLSLIILPDVLAQDMRQERMDDPRGRSIEMKGDRKFVQQSFDRAMKIYETAFKYSLTSDYAASLHLKVGRLYFTLSDYAASIPHYDAAINASEQLFSSMDVCNFLDALRFSGQKMKAVSLARKYAYKDAYKADQRYRNILHALDYSDGFMPIGTPEFIVRPVENINTSYSEFWVGKKGREYFYASSKSRFHDPNKKFYHRTGYHPIHKGEDKSDREDFLDMVPSGLQNGPVTFSDDMTRMVVTQVMYGRQGIAVNAQGLNAFQTRLYHSDYNKKRKGWSSFKEAFPQKEGYSYSHPFFIDNDRSLLFASDMPGGYGGYDIYVVHWDDANNAWGRPVNLGPQVNTEGDEISPALFGETLLFASNGHVGFGGYDIYSINYEEGQVKTGSLYHFAYPVNTVMNDFGLLYINKDSGYLVSDRNQADDDDVFYFERNNSPLQVNSLLSGISEAKAISSGFISFAAEGNETTKPRNEKVVLPNYLTKGMLTLFFDFDQYILTETSKYELDKWYKTTDFSRIDTLIIEGYADEMGTEDYNYKLSTKRAKETVAWLTNRELYKVFLMKGKGRVLPDKPWSYIPPFYQEKNIPYSSKIDPIADRIWYNREYRRVEIKAIIKL